MSDLPLMPATAAESSAAAESLRLKQQVDGLRHRLQPGQGNEAQLRQACTDFEAIFMGKLWEQMRRSVPKEGYLHGKFEDQYLGLFDQEFSKKMAQGGGIGLGDMLYSQLKDKLAKASKDTAPGAGTAIKPLRGAAEGPAVTQPLPPRPGQAAALEPAAQTQPQDVAALSPTSADRAADRLGGMFLQREVDALAARIVAQAESAPAAPVQLQAPAAVPQAGPAMGPISASPTVLTSPPAPAAATPAAPDIAASATAMAPAAAKISRPPSTLIPKVLNRPTVSPLSRGPSSANPLAAKAGALRPQGIILQPKPETRPQNAPGTEEPS